MVNFQFNLASISGIVLAVGGASLYAVRSFRPQIARDTDIFFSAVGLLCGLILIFYGWRFDPIMQFGQVLLTGAAVYFVFENLRLRQISTEQAKRTTPIVDDDRPVSSQYTAAFEDDYTVSFPNREPRTPLRESGRSRRPAREEEYDDRPPIRERSSRADEPRLRPASRTPRSRQPESFDEPREDVRPRRNTSRNNTRPRRNNKIEDINQPDDAGYVDYRPIDTNRNDGWGE
ncbi:Ycf66 family protein [Leptolyngbya sp. AN03gr2]|uniref:Ycf66 family protein n=1 Tax=unclassified Leptolyngbya TaxID=2650499 RepID=UPI003D318A57